MKTNITIDLDNSDKKINLKTSFDKKNYYKDKSRKACKKAIRNLSMQNQIFELANEIRDSKKPKIVEEDLSDYLERIIKNPEQLLDQEKDKKEPIKQNFVENEGTKKAKTNKEVETVASISVKHINTQNHSQITTNKPSFIKGKSHKVSHIDEVKSTFSREFMFKNMLFSKDIEREKKPSSVRDIRVGRAFVTKILARYKPKYSQDNFNLDEAKKNFTYDDDLKYMSLFNNLDKLQSFNIIDDFSDKKIS